MVIVHFSPPNISNMVFPLPPTFPPPSPHLKANNNSVRNRNTKCYNVSNTSQKAGQTQVKTTQISSMVYGHLLKVKFYSSLDLSTQISTTGL